jgi:pimeloyl-ACP methyl ester carboxylesterase
MPTIAGRATLRRQVLLKDLQGRRLEDAYLRPDLRALMEEEADATPPDDPDPLITREMLQTLDQLVKARRERDLALTDRRSPSATRDLAQSRLLSSATAVIVPGFLASQLSDKSTDPPGSGLIWINPLATFFADRLSSLRLAVPLGGDGGEHDADPRVRIMPDGPLPIVYDLLRASLETSLFASRYWTHVFAFDWRRNLEDAAAGLALFLRSLRSQAPTWNIHVIAHSQGALVARRALQNLHQGDRKTFDKVGSLVLLGPANFGSMSAVRGLGNEVTEVDFVRKFSVEPGPGFNSVLSTFSGLYQLIPSRPDLVPWLNSNAVSDPSWWGTFPVDASRLNQFVGWAEGIDSSSFDDRTAVILGGDDVHSPTGSTVGGVKIDGPGSMAVDPAFGMLGDGTVPHSCAILPGVKTYQVVGAEHSTLPTYSRVISAVQAVLQGRTPSLPAVASNDPTAYAAPRPYQIRSLGRGAEPTRNGQTVVPDTTATDALGQLAASLATTAHQTNARLRITVDVDPIRAG